MVKKRTGINQLVTNGDAASNFSCVVRPSAPWLKAISKDGLRWTVTGGVGFKQDSAKISFDIEMADGTHLTDESNKNFYDVAAAYAETIRLYMPELSAFVHASRVRGLLTFLYWLRIYGVKSLADVTSDHIGLYQERISLGREWVLEGPHRILRYLNGMHTHERSELAKRSSQYVRDAVRHSAGISPFVQLGSLSKGVIEFIRKQPELHKLPNIDEILQEHLKASTPLTIQSLHRYLLPIEEAWLWRDHLPGPHLLINPFPHGSMSVANALGAVSQRTPTIPPKMAFSYLSGAVKWVLDYAPFIIDASASKPDNGALAEMMNSVGLHKLFNADQNGGAKNRLLTGYAGLVNMLSAACLAVIAGLSAQRVDAIYDLGAGCINSDGDRTHWLIIYIEKTTRKYDQVPVPAIVAKAVACLERLSESARLSNGTDSIWQWRHPETGVIRELNPEKYLDDLATVNSITQNDGNLWHFTPHQFRRFFALVYFWRYEKGDLAALAHHLRHIDLEMTRRYVTDVAFNKLWRESEREYRETFLREVVYGSRNIGGKAGTRILKEAKKLVDIYRKHIEVVPVERIVARLSRLAERWGAEFRQHVWGTICACPHKTGLATLARCKGAENAGPVFENACEESCLQCPFAIHTSRYNEFAEERLQKNNKNLSVCKKGTLLADLLQMNVHILERDLSHGIPPPCQGQTVSE